MSSSSAIPKSERPNPPAGSITGPWAITLPFSSSPCMYAPCSLKSLVSSDVIVFTKSFRGGKNLQKKYFTLRISFCLSVLLRQPGFHRVGESRQQPHRPGDEIPGTYAGNAEIPWGQRIV